jgi:hypothetical protein
MAEGGGYGNFGASLVIATTEDEFFREKKNYVFVTNEGS